MKTSLKSFLVIALIGLHSCSPKLQPYSGEVNFLSKEAIGTITVKSIGNGKNQNDAIMDAEKNAFYVILFKGIPGTDLNVPLIENEDEVKSKHASYLKYLFDDTNYKSYIMSSSNLIKIKKNKKISLNIKINYNSLRKNLEQNQVVRKFGY
jgi:hypothetical protein